MDTIREVFFNTHFFFNFFVGFGFSRRVYDAGMCIFLGEFAINFEKRLTNFFFIFYAGFSFFRRVYDAGMCIFLGNFAINFKKCLTNNSFTIFLFRF